ncbi:MAG: hypothetical protein A2W90_08365 [Bacteroidetes bacterium GWF2_42_66]|nr:MAG: hypothetical protein A2W92_15065 [Bacteroidetes bacterium GWA2_42_15]OFX96486.1 MAG: hypothetical protein A2W89_06025 [Bacteroidetes bacterium GWE2_42_39]OFY40906.1 MAG: hypothetical protein A2W90_08365 [Bacteroidetes bacterium GWF2_42_66]HBL76338.1 hypothetical protein [Prolixibacteraceae bacterium]HCR92108.1 hypothetical protein [Prolixibacteraceae bacterium]
MKKIINYILFIAIAATLTSCMEEVGDFTVNGEAITGFELTSPNNNLTITINKSALSETYAFSWDEAESGLGSAIAYTILFDRQDGDFSNPIWSKASDNSGASAKATLSFTELQQVYTAAGGSGTVTVKWNVKAENGSPNVKMGQVANTVKLVVSAAGISNFTLVSPIDKSILLFDGSKENDAFAFDWNNATTTSGTVKYKFYLDEAGGDFSSPLLTIDSDTQGTVSQVSMTHGAWKALLEQNNIAKGSYSWTVKAISTDLEWMKEVFDVYIDFVNWRKPIYIVGEATSVGWDIGKALEMNFIAPNVWSGVFELKAGKEFKFFPEKGSWDNGIGSDRFTNFIGCSDKGGNFGNSGTTDGYYFVIVDLNTKTITVSASPKILGGSVVADWNTENAVPMQHVGGGVFDTYQYITVDGWGFKFVPMNSGWDGDFGASKTKEGYLSQTDENNLTVPANGFYRVRVNMNDFSYSVLETTWGIIGGATSGGWSDDTNMTLTSAVKGEYKWTADITLATGEIKFRANDGWDINFGDDGANGSLEYGGGNIAVTAGNYHIELILNSATGFTYKITAN